MWPAEHRLQQLMRYRASSTKEFYGGDSLVEALELMRPELSYAELLKQKPKHLPPKPTWARLAAGAAVGIRHILCGLRTDEQVTDAVKHAALLTQRLEQRTGRVPTDVRDAIVQVKRLARGLLMMHALAVGDRAPEKLTLDDGGVAIALRRHWAACIDLAYAQSLVQRATAKVLASSAHGAIKGMFSKAVAAWADAPSRDDEPPAKRSKKDDDDYDDWL
jgi:hypothetical protein